MNIRNIFLFGISSFLFFNATCLGTDWRLINETLDGANYYNADSVKWISKNVVQVWTKGFLTPEGVEWWVRNYGEKYNDLSIFISLGEIDCSEQKMRVQNATYYGHNGLTIESDNSVSEWADVIPDTDGASLLDILCKQEEKEIPKDTKQLK